MTHGIEEKQLTCILPMADSIFIKTSVNLVHNAPVELPPAQSFPLLTPVL